MPHPRVLCDLCKRPVPPHGHYIMRIDVFADPQMPEVSSEEMEEADREVLALWEILGRLGVPV